MATTTRVAPRRDGDRRSTIIGAALAAVLAAALFAVALNRGDTQKKRALAPGKPTAVVVVSKLLRRDTLITAGRLSSAFTLKHVPSAAAKAGALASLDEAQGKVLKHDVYAGEQITAADLTDDRGSIETRLSGDERAVTLPVDKLHALAGDVSDGDHVDVYATFNLQIKDSSHPVPVLRLLAEDVTVLHAPAAVTGGNSDTDGRITLGAPSAIAQQLAFSADFGKVWIAARPASGASKPPPSVVTLDQIVLGDDRAAAAAVAAAAQATTATADAPTTSAGTGAAPAGATGGATTASEGNTP